MTKNGFIILVIKVSLVFTESPQYELSISIISIPDIKQANSNKGFFPINSCPINIKFGFLFSKALNILITISIFSSVILI